MDLPVTLVIKAPNQRVDDHHVDCMMDWTVKKLKQHLTNVYPSKPRETQQKLIYSGKLLADHMTLKEVLRSFDDGSNKHTVHLVCSSPQESPSSTSTGFHSRQDSASSNSSVGSLPDTEGLRYRGTTPSSTPSQGSLADQGTPPQNMFNPYMGGFPTGLSPETLMYGGINPTGGLGYSPEQYMIMQQMYQHYMAQYMQYYQQAGLVTPPGTPVQNPDGTEPQNQAENQQRGPAAAAAGVAGVDDDDEEFGQRDWLDYLYVVSRFMVLLGIVYFYSSITRFLMVAGFFFIVYAYQMGWLGIFGPQRRQRPQQQQQQQQQPQQHPQQQPQQQQQQQNINEQPAAENVQTEAQPNTQSVPQEPLAGPSNLQIAWTFVSTFFTSLFPTPPPPVNAN